MNAIKTLAKLHNWNVPTVCPICGGELELSENHCQLKCVNDFCQSKTAGRINKWTGILDVKEFGLRTINLLIDNGIVDSISSLYKMDLNKIAKIEGMGKRSAEKMKKELDAHKEMTLAKFIAGYNIEGVGEKVIENIIKFYNFKTLSDFYVSTSSQRFVCDGVGSVISTKLSEGLKALKSDMEKTLQFVTIKNAAPKKVVAGGSLGGKSFCFTGAASMPRKKL
jgi:DNA ligase (NAD+)